MTVILTSIPPALLFADLGIPPENRQLIYSVTAVGILIVLFALLVVSLSVALMSKTIRHSEARRQSAASAVNTGKSRDKPDEAAAAAIAAALYLHQRSREEEEKAILTIRKVIKPLSGWSNKSYGMRKPGIL
jgi:Na+-transporting methylmalonyl-CoA/oxaloacetate decarboxylase gamma subunit